MVKLPPHILKLIGEYKSELALKQYHRHGLLKLVEFLCPICKHKTNASAFGRHMKFIECKRLQQILNDINKTLEIKKVPVQDLCYAFYKLTVAEVDMYIRNEDEALIPDINVVDIWENLNKK